MNPTTAPTSSDAGAGKDARPTREQTRKLDGLTAQARDNLVERVRAARKRLPKAPPQVARLR